MSVSWDLVSKPLDVAIMTGSDRTQEHAQHFYRPQTGYSLWRFIAGAAALRRDGEESWLPLPTHTCFLLQPHEPITLHIPDKAILQRIIFTIRGGPRHLNAQHVLILDDGPQPPSEAFLGVRLPLAIPDQLADATGILLERLCSLWWRDPRSRLRANAMLHVWLLDLLDGLQPAPPFDIVDAPARPAAWIGVLDEYVRSVVHRRVSVEMMAEILHISRMQLYRRLMKTFHATPSEYVERIRSEIALELVETTDDPIGNIARTVGYKTPQAFSRWFAKRHGKSPRDWRLGT